MKLQEIIDDVIVFEDRNTWLKQPIGEVVRVLDMEVGFAATGGDLEVASIYTDEKGKIWIDLQPKRTKKKLAKPRRAKGSVAKKSRYCLCIDTIVGVWRAGCKVCPDCNLPVDRS